MVCDANEKILIKKSVSAQIFYLRGQTSCLLKIFESGSWGEDFVNLILLGTPHPCLWNESFLKRSHFRRKVASFLVQFWFEKKMFVASSKEVICDARRGEKGLFLDFVQGRFIRLSQPFDLKASQEYEPFYQEFIRPLHQFLKDSGMEGLLWKSGQGNSRFLENFIRTDKGCWCWFDLEPSVPPFFSLNILLFFRLYFPLFFKYRRIFFDYTDFKKLYAYIDVHKEALLSSLGQENYLNLIENVDQLQLYEQQFLSMNREQRVLKYYLSTGRVTQDQYDFYIHNKWHWKWRMFIDKFVLLFKLPFSFFLKVFSFFLHFEYLKVFKSFFKCIFDEDYFRKKSQSFLRDKLKYWYQRQQFNDEQYQQLDQSIHRLDGHSYNSDIFMTLFFMKFFIKSFQIFFLFPLFLKGSIHSAVMIVLFLFLGSIMRTIYTVTLIIWGSPKKRMIAFWIGMLPVLGNLSYLFQMFFSFVKSQRLLGRFLLFDFFTKIGTAMPIWGGEYSLVELFFNRVWQKIEMYMNFRYPKND